MPNGNVNTYILSGHFDGCSRKVERSHGIQRLGDSMKKYLGQVPKCQSKVQSSENEKDQVAQPKRRKEDMDSDSDNDPEL